MGTDGMWWCAARVVSPVGIEPTTNWLKANCSTTELRARCFNERCEPRSRGVVKIRMHRHPVNRSWQTQEGGDLLPHFGGTHPGGRGGRKWGMKRMLIALVLLLSATAVFADHHMTNSDSPLRTLDFMAGSWQCT